MTTWKTKNPVSFTAFLNEVKGAEHGSFSRGFVRENSSLRNLLTLLENGEPTAHEVAAEVNKLPPDKKKKYKRALDLLFEAYPGLNSSFDVAPDLRSRVARIGEHLELLKSPLRHTRDCVIWGHAGHVPDDPKLGGTFKVPTEVTLHFYTIHAQANSSRPEVALSARPDDTETSFAIETPLFEITKNVDGSKTKVPMLTGKNGAVQVRAGTLSNSAGGRNVAEAEKRRKNFTKANKLLRGNDALEGKVFGPNAECHNYVIKNGLGVHWASPNEGTGAPWSVTDVLRLQDKLLEARLALGDRADAAALARAWVPHFVFVRSEGVVLLSELLKMVRDTIVKLVNEQALMDRNIDNGIDEPTRDFYFAGCRGIYVGWKPALED
jgi:hypothetical protein